MQQEVATRNLGFGCQATQAYGQRGLAMQYLPKCFVYDRYTIVYDRSLRSYNDCNDGAWAWPGLGAVWGYVGTHIGAVRTHDQPRMCGPDDCIRRCTSSCEHGFPNGTARTSRTVSAARMPFTCPAASQSPPLQELTGTLRKAKKYKDRYRILYRRHNLGLDPDQPPAGA